MQPFVQDKKKKKNQERNCFFYINVFQNIYLSHLLIFVTMISDLF